MKSLLFALILCSGSLNAQELVMKIINPQVDGNQVTYDVVVEQFTDLISMQYSIQYDKTVLSFVALENMSVPEMDIYDFNTAIAGVILNSWYHPLVLPTSLKNGTIIFQIVFEMQYGTYGTVCFSEDPLMSEFARAGEELVSFTVVDDCHPSPHQISLITSTEELAKYGMKLNTVIRSQKISFTLDHQQTLEFRLFDVKGNLITSVPTTNYPAGDHTLKTGSTLVPGVYLLTTEIANHPVAIKIIYP